VRRVLLVLAALALAAAGCGSEGSSTSASERADPPAKPPRGWRTVTNAEDGFTLSVPRNWSVRATRGATVISSPDKLDVITLAADRGAEARSIDAATYAERTIAALPDFEGSLAPQARRVRGSPYRSARIDGQGSLKTSRRAQRITVVAFQRPGRVTYAAVIFRNPRVDPRYDEPRLRRILRSFRARPPGKS
jgi:hypothetical protein